jgi:DNA-binding IclR family transcriptional regulator
MIGAKRFSVWRKMSEASPDRGDVRTIDRAVTLLRLMCTHTQVGWRLTDLANEAGLGVATTHRLLAGLLDAGLVARVPASRRYGLGPLAYLCGTAAAPHYDVDRIASPRLVRCARSLEGTLFLKVRSGDDTVCIARHDAGAPVPALLLEVGGRRPMALTAGGAAILVALPRSQQTRIERSNAVSITSGHRASWASVRRMLARSRAHAFGLNLGDIVPGICAVAVAVPHRGAAPVAALSLALDASTLSERRIETIVYALRSEAVSLEADFARLRY